MNPTEEVSSDKAPDGKTAVITGASSGIGEVFARKLASQGYDLVLVARRKDRLARLCEELQEKHALRAEACVADLAKPEDVRRVEQRIADAEGLEMLVNNAGFGIAGYFADVDVGKQLDMIHVHVVASVRFARAALPGMIARGCGFIINVSSVASFVTGAGSVSYCATKAYLNSFSESLQAELKGTGVRVQALCPGFTYTEFHDRPEYEDFDRSQIPRFLWMPAEDVVDVSLRALKGKRVICIPGFKNRLLVEVIRNRLTNPIMRMLFEKRLEK